MKKLIISTKIILSILLFFMIFFLMQSSNYILLNFIKINSLLLLVFFLFTFYKKDFFLIKTLEKLINNLLTSSNKNITFLSPTDFKENILKKSKNVKKIFFAFLITYIVYILSNIAFLINLLLILQFFIKLINLHPIKEYIIKIDILEILNIILSLFYIIKIKIIYKLKKNELKQFNLTLKSFSEYINKLYIKTYKINKIIYIYQITFLIIFILIYIFQSYK